jgi:transposase
VQARREEHQFCLAHLIRNAQYAIDHGDTIFAPDFKALFKDACAVGRHRPDLADATIAAHRRRLERQLDQLLACKPTDAEGRKLRDAVALDCRGKLFVFLKHRDAEPTNNGSERVLRPLVIFRKVTNGFRSEWGAKAYAALAPLSKPAAATAGAPSPPSATPWSPPRPRQPPRGQPA